MNKRHIYTKEQEAFIKKNYPKCKNVKSFVKDFNDMFKTNLSYCALKGYANRRLKLRTDHRVWTEEMNTDIASLILKYPYKKATEIFNKRHKTSFSVTKVINHCTKLGLKRHYYQQLEKVDEIIFENSQDKTYEEIRKIVNKRLGTNYINYTAMVYRANNIGIKRPHRKWDNINDQKYINGEKVNHKIFTRFMTNKFHRIEKELQPIALEIVKLQHLISESEV